MAMQYVQTGTYTDSNGEEVPEYAWVDSTDADNSGGLSFDPTQYGWTFDAANDLWKDSSGNPVDLSASRGTPTLSSLFSSFGNALTGKGGAGQQILATAGIGALLNSLGLGSSGGGFSGYKGGIPKYDAKRSVLPIPKETIVTPAVAATATEAEKPAVTTPRRPGSGGITYFSPMTYAPFVANPDATIPTTGGVGATTTPTPTPTTNDQGYTTFDPTIYVAKGGAIKGMASGGISSLGGYSDGGQLLRGPGDGVSDSIPATIGGKQKAALADGEFVVPARIVSELGNGSTEAGARKLYAMMDRIKKARSKAKNIAADTKAYKHLPA